jgi:hypothetical protein
MLSCGVFVGFSLIGFYGSHKLARSPPLLLKEWNRFFKMSGESGLRRGKG